MGKNLDVNIATKSSNDMNRSNFGSGSDVQKMYSDDALYPGYMMRLLEDQNTLRKKYYTKLARKFAFNRASSWDFMKNRYKGFWPKTDAKIRILDVGSGTGEHTLQFAIGFPNAEVVGIDLSPGSVAAADRLKEHFGVNNVTFIKMDLIEDDLSRLGKFDLINCSGVLHHTESPEKSLQNIQQCMIPDKSVIWIFLYSNWLRHKEKSIRESLRIIFPNDDSLAERVQFCKNIGMTRGSIYYHASLQHRIINNFKKIRETIRYRGYNRYVCRAHETDLYDGFAHPIARFFDGYSIEKLFQSANLELVNWEFDQMNPAVIQEMSQHVSNLSEFDKLQAMGGVLYPSAIYTIGMLSQDKSLIAARREQAKKVASDSGRGYQPFFW